MLLLSAVKVIVISPVKKPPPPNVAPLATRNIISPSWDEVPAEFELTVTPVGRVPTTAVTGTLVIPLYA